MRLLSKKQMNPLVFQRMAQISALYGRATTELALDHTRLEQSLTCRDTADALSGIDSILGLLLAWMSILEGVRLEIKKERGEKEN